MSIDTVATPSMMKPITHFAISSQDDKTPAELLLVVFTSMFLFGIFSVGAFVLMSDSVGGAYRVVTLFILFILFSNVIAGTLLHE